MYNWGELVAWFCGRPLKQLLLLDCPGDKKKAKSIAYCIQHNINLQANTSTAKDGCFWKKAIQPSTVFYTMQE